MKKKVERKKIIINILIVFLIVLTLVIDILSVRFYTVATRWWSGTFTSVSEDAIGYSQLEVQDSASLLTQTVESEGAVLLKNSGVLPLSPRKINLVGYASVDPMYIGAGSVSQSGSYASNVFIDYYTAFSFSGYICNQDLKEYYESATDIRDNNGGGMFNMNGSDYDILDQPLNTYANVLNSASDYSDTAIVIISRTGGEGSDEPLDMATYVNGDAGKHYLELQQTEIDMLDYCKSNFETVIVLINSSNAMELGFLDDEGIDAALWIGAPGSSGLQAVSDIIAGYTNPSGKLPDTYAYDLTTAPSYYTGTAGTYANYDAFDDSADGFDNKVDGGVTYYTEGIYVGYRYYETAAAEGYIDYEETVQYPFGYGLSYTTFDWEVMKETFGDVHGEIEIEVKVTNTGDVAGKDVVELYYTPPYFEGGIEKSEKVLAAFGKTAELAPGESDTLTLRLNVDDIASYDYSGNGCYVADAGNYDFNLQTDSHTIKAGCETMTYQVDETWVYNDAGVGKRSTDLIVAENQFDISSAGDGNINNTIPYVSRADFENTMPQVTMGGQHITEMTINMGEDMIAYMLNSNGGSDVDYANDANYITESLIAVETNQDNGLTVDDLAGYSVWEDEVWDKLVNQMSVEDMVLLLSDCGYGTPAIASIGKSLATDVDGPAGVSSANLNFYGNEYTSEPVMAATWNIDLIYLVGESVGKECNLAGISGWYAPGANIHRTPFNGRCGEYYSEDALLSGKIAAAEVAGAQDQGIYVYLKHFVVNDQDSKRGGMYTWLNEQALREIYLAPWEYAVKEADLTGIMLGYNRIGPMENAVCYASNTTVLKKEWGFKGLALTDGYSAFIGCDKYEAPDLQLRAGGGMLLYVGGYSGEGGYTELTTESEYGIQMLHDASKRLLYRHCNSNAVNISRDYTPYWLIFVGILNVLFIGMITLLAWKFYIKPSKRKKGGSNE